MLNHLQFKSQNSLSLGDLGFVSQYEDCSQHNVLYYRYVECPNRDFLSLLATHVCYTLKLLLINQYVGTYTLASFVRF